MKYETLLVDIEDGVATVTLNRSQKKNAMNPTLHKEMTDALEKLRYDDSARVIVFTGAGDAFCAGMDLKEFFIDLKDKPKEYDFIQRISIEWRGRTIRHFPKVTIAMVNGFCFGGAFTIVESCDLATAVDTAKFGLSEINFKMFPAGSVSKAMGYSMNSRHYLWHALTGRPFDAKRAVEIGFINAAYPAAELKRETMAVAKEIAAKDPSATRATKETYKFSLDMDWDMAMDYSSAKEAQHTYRQNDAFRKEGIGDFLKGEYKPGLGGRETQGRKS